MIDAEHPVNPLRDYAMLFAWCAAVMLIASSFFFLTSSIRKKTLIGNVNETLSVAGDPRRAVSVAPSWGAAGRAAVSGDRLILGGGAGTAVVFAIENPAANAVCVAVLDQDGKLSRLFPLSDVYAEALSRTPRGYVEAYTLRLETVERAMAERKTKK